MRLKCRRRRGDAHVTRSSVVLSDTGAQCQTCCAQPRPSPLTLAPLPIVAEPAGAAQQAAVAAAEAIAAEAAAGIAAEAAAVAAEVVAAASLAAAKATAKANRTAAEAAVEIAAVAQAVAETASAAAVVAAASVDHTGRQAVADIAEAARVADGVVHAASSAAAQSAARAHLAATETADELALEAAAVAADVVTAAAAAAAKVVEAGDAAAKLMLATATALRMPAPEGAKLGNVAAGQARLDEPLHREWASVLADPVMPRSWAASAPLATVVSAALPAEQGLWRDISLARRMQAALRASEAHFEAAFFRAPTAMLTATLEDGQPARFTQVNQAMTELTGRAASHLLGFGFADLAQAEHRALEKDPTRPFDGKNAQPDERVRRWVHADGHGMWVRIRMAELATSTARKVELVCQVEDISAQVGSRRVLGHRRGTVPPRLLPRRAARVVDRVDRSLPGTGGRRQPSRVRAVRTQRGRDVVARLGVINRRC